MGGRMHRRRRRARPYRAQGEAEMLMGLSDGFLIQYALVRHMASSDDMEPARAALVAELMGCGQPDACPLHGNPKAMRQLARELAAIAATLCEAVGELS